MPIPLRLDEPGLLRAVDVVATLDPKLRGIVERHGPPPLWARDPSFPTLVRIILQANNCVRHRLRILGGH